MKTVQVEKVPPIDRTVILVDCKEDATLKDADLPSVSLDLQFGDRSSQLSVVKNGLCSIIEAVTEYSRIAYDLFPDQTKISVYSIRDTLVRHNGWGIEDQTLTKIMESFDGIKPVHSETDVTKAFEQAIQSLSEPVDAKDNRNNSLHYRRYKQKKTNNTRIILISSQLDVENMKYHDMASSSSVNISEKIQSIFDAQQGAKSDTTVVDHCEVLLISLKDNKTTSSNLQQISPSLSLVSVSIKVSDLVNSFFQLVSQHFNLKSIKVDGIPMKEKEGESRSLYAVSLFYPSYNNEKSVTTLVDTQRKFEENSMQLRWKSIDRKTNPDTLYTSTVHRVTPLYINASSSNGLMKHILSGKPVILATIYPLDSPNYVEVPEGAIPSTSPIPTSHLLLSHGGDVYIHFLNQESVSLTDIPALSIYQQVDTNALRTKDFSELLDKNILRLPKSKEVVEPLVTVDGYQTNRATEKMTRYFPLLEGETLLFSKDQSQDLRLLVNSVKTAFMQDEIMQEEVETCNALITRLYQCYVNNEVRLFPQLGDKQGARSDVYQKLWSELKQFAKLYASSPNHKKILATLDRLDPREESSKMNIETDNNVNNNNEKQTSPHRPSSGGNHTAALYTGLQQPKQEKVATDMWEQYELAKKEKDQQTWLKSDASQLPVLEMEKNKNHEKSERNNWKRPKIEQILDNCNTDSLFFKYWSVTQAKQAHEFDGRKD